MSRFCFPICRWFNSFRHCCYNKDFTCFFRIMDFFLRKVLGQILVTLVYSLLGFVVFTVFTVVLPFETLYQPTWCIVLLAIFALYLIVNIVFHYFKASNTHPGNPPNLSCEPLCRYCLSFKPIGTHHCVICNECVLKMDHHCVWINQCVGAKNHRHFLQFLAFLITGCATFVICGFHAFYYNYWHRFTDNEFCNDERLDWLPWLNTFCGNQSSFINLSMFFSYFLCLIIFFIVGSLFYWNFVLISANTTFIELLQQNVGFRQIIRKIFFPWRNANFRNTWRRFLGLKKNNKRTFVRHILFPSSHNSFIYEEDMPLMNSLQSVQVDTSELVAMII